MALAQATKSYETTYTLDDAMDILLTKLDDAINDMENGKVRTIKQAVYGLETLPGVPSPWQLLALVQKFWYRFGINLTNNTKDTFVNFIGFNCSCSTRVWENRNPQQDP